MEYALHYLEDEVCEFLIDKGADVDAMEPRLPRPEESWDDTEYQDEVVWVIHFTFNNPKVFFQTNTKFRTPLNRISESSLYDGDCKEEEFASTLRCRRLLLNAGADPMPHDSFGELFKKAEASLTSVRISS